MPLIKMERYTLQEFAKKMVKIWQTVHKTRTFLGRHEAPSRTAIKKLVEKFELLGQVSDVKNKSRAGRSRTAENIADVAESVEESPGEWSIER